MQIHKTDNITNPVKSSSPSAVAKEKTNSVFSEYDMMNGEIETTMQSTETGDCWLLTGVNALNTTKWGKQIIKNSLKPDGEGGAIVTLKGAEGSQKEFRVTIADMEKALGSSKYSIGDDDMLAIELAVEKYAKKQVAAGKLKKDPNAVLNGGIDRNMMYLLSGVPTHDFGKDDKNTDNALDLIMKNPQKYAVYCGFQEDSENLDANHAYTIKEIKKDLKGNKVVVLINPQNSSETETVPYDEFRPNLRILTVLDDPKNPDSGMKSEIDYLNDEIEALKKSEENTPAKKD